MPDQNSALALTIQGVSSTDLTDFLTDNVIPIRHPRPCADLSGILGTSSNRECALDLGRRGFAVFPVRDWGDGGGWKPVKGFPEKASCDPTQINDWWRLYPEARAGLLTGQRNGITLLDLDVKNGKDGIATLAQLGFPDVTSIALCRTRTPTGGLHLFFAYDPRLKGTVGKIGEGIDVRNNGNYAIAPESFKDGKLYRTEGLPLSREHLAPFPESLVPAVVQSAEPVEPGQASPQQIEWARVELSARAAVLAGTSEGSRQYELNAVALWAGGVAAHGAIEREEAYQILKDASNQCGLPPREFESSFAHGFKDGLRKPIRLPVDVSDDDFDDLPDELKTKKESGLTFLSPAECDSAPSREYLVKGLLSRGDVACIFGAPGAGKSLLAPFLGYAVAQGREVFGMRSKPGGVFYVAAEDESGMRGRVRALRLAHGDADNFRLVGGVSDLLVAASPDLAALVAAVKEQRPALIFLDTLAMAFPGLEENSAEGMGQVIAVARRLTKWGAAVVLIHHDTKAEGATPRGHSLFNGALYVALHVKRDEAGVIRAKMTKNRNGSCDRDIAFVIAIEEGGSDEDGDVITLPRCQPVTGQDRTKETRLTASESAVLALLRTMPQPVAERDFRLAAIEGRTVSAAEDADSRRKAFKRAIESLLRKKWITFDGANYREEDGFDDAP